MVPLILKMLYRHLRQEFPNHLWTIDDRPDPDDVSISLSIIDPITEIVHGRCNDLASIYFCNGIIEGAWDLEPQLNVPASDPELFVKVTNWITELIAWEFGRDMVKG